jgi:cytosine/adenosine deaminase-related metal-dependent hydrolase
LSRRVASAGRIAPGYKADIVMLDLDHPNWLPFNDPVNLLVHTEDGTAVISVMIGGRLAVVLPLNKRGENRCRFRARSSFREGL